MRKIQISYDPKLCNFTCLHILIEKHVISRNWIHKHDKKGHNSTEKCFTIYGNTEILNISFKFDGQLGISLLNDKELPQFTRKCSRTKFAQFTSFPHDLNNTNERIEYLIISAPTVNSA